MAMKYMKSIKDKVQFSKAPPKPHSPVLTDEDEAFLRHVAEKTKEHGGNAQVALMDGAQNIPLPTSPGADDDLDRELALEGSKSRVEEEQKEKENSVDVPKKNNRWSWIMGKEKPDKGKAPADPTTVAADEVKKEEEDIADVLERLNLAAVNNRVFSLGDETQDLLEKFKLVFKDLVNGVPTAYRDLEELITNGDKVLQGTFNRLPKFLRDLVEKLPDKATARFAPEILAAATEKAGKHGLNAENAGKAAGAAKKMGFKVPSLKELVGKPAAIAGMLRSIMTFLRARFPALLGLNVLWSMALFVLLLVLWYCHKRGREERLEKEKVSREASESNLEESTAGQPETSAIVSPEDDSTGNVEMTGRIGPEAQDSPALPGVGGQNTIPSANKQTRRKPIEPYEGT